MEKYNFQNCQKIVVFSSDGSAVLLCKRKGEADFDNMFSFIGGKMEITDKTIIDGLRREKNEELGQDFRIKIYPTFNETLLYTKKDGNQMVLPHYYAVHVSGEITLNEEEYSEYKWVKIDELEEFEPKIPSVYSCVKQLLKLKQIISENDLIEI